MPVNSCRSDYEEFKARWTRLRDTFGGREKVIEAGTKYVPDLKGLDIDQNKAYRNRGNYYNAVSRTVFGLVGTIFQKAPVFKLPHAFEEYLKDITQTGVTMEMFALEAGHETMLVGRYGVLVDMPQQPAPPAAPVEVRPYLVAFRAENIINWRVERNGGDEQLTLLVLAESYEERDEKDPFVLKRSIQYRVCQLSGGVYQQQLYRKPSDKNEFFPFGEPIVPIRRGKSLSFIPFVFFGATNNTSELGQPPLLDLAEVNLAHWRNSVDHEHGLHLVALPTPWVSGMRGASNNIVKIGPSNVWELEINGSAGMVEFTGNGLKALVDAMDEKKRQMATLGARMLETQNTGVETATVVLIRHSGDYANVRTIAQTLETSFTLLLQTMGWWMGTQEKPNEVDASCELNKEFLQVKADPQTIQTALTALQAGEMSFKTWYQILVTGGWAREGISAEEERKDIDAEAPEDEEIEENDLENPDDDTEDEEDPANPKKKVGAVA